MADAARLRPVRAGDERALESILGDERAVRDAGLPVLSAGQVRAFVALLRDGRQPPGLPPQRTLVIEDDAGDAAGLCGLVLAEDGRTGAVWYLLRPASRGRGLAVGAVRALASAAFAELPIDAIEAHCLERNAASARVLARAGFRREGGGRHLLGRDAWAHAQTEPAPRAPGTAARVGGRVVPSPPASADAVSGALR